MEPLLAFIVDFWWIAPASVGAGGVGYAVITKNSRRARRLELDAARHEEAEAYRASLTAKAHVRAAVAQVQTAQAHRARPTAGVPTVPEARRALALAKQAQKDAALLLRAARSRVKAVQTALSASAKDSELPIERVMHAHDEITARWLAYETDAALALAYPQMSDARHPDTFAFLRAQSEAHRLRPANPKVVVKPDAFVAYRRAVEQLGGAFTAAEQSARRAAATEERRFGLPNARPVWPVPGRTSRPAQPGGGTGA